MMPYHRFRSGLSFRDVRSIVEQESARRYQREGQYIRVSRTRVLGKWRELKLSFYESYTKSVASR